MQYNVDDVHDVVVVVVAVVAQVQKQKVNVHHHQDMVVTIDGRVPQWLSVVCGKGVCAGGGCCFFFQLARWSNFQNKRQKKLQLFIN